MDWYREEAKKRQVEALLLGNKTRHDESPIVESFPQSALQNNIYVSNDVIESLSEKTISSIYKKKFRG